MFLALFLSGGGDGGYSKCLVRAWSLGHGGERITVFLGGGRELGVGTGAG